MALELITFAFVLPHVRESRKNFARRIRNPGFEIWNTAQGIRIQGLLTQTRIRSIYASVRIQYLESRIQDCLGFPYMGRFGVNSLQAGSPDQS